MTDAWDDDWIIKADKKPSPAASSANTPKLSKAERRAKQAEFNRQIWADAEREDDNFFLKSQGVVPLKEEFKPAVKVLSRKPPKVSTPNAGLNQLSINDDDDDDGDDANKANSLTLEERQKKAQREREEKQKAYDERRRQLFGGQEQLAASTERSTGSNSRNQMRPTRSNESRPSSSTSVKTKNLYDPNDNSPKPESMRPQRKDISTLANEVKPIRKPKPPDGSGRGGFGFAPGAGRMP